jgi:hypothetical protein
MVEHDTQRQPAQLTAITIPDNNTLPDWLANLLAGLEGWTLDKADDSQRYKLIAPATGLTTSAELAIICKHLTSNSALIHQLSGCQSLNEKEFFFSPLIIVFQLH